MKTTTITNGFPFDSEWSGEDKDGLPIGDRQYYADDLRRAMKTMLHDGVIADYGQEMAVTCDTTGVKVAPGSAIADGILFDLRETANPMARAELATGHYYFVVAAVRFDLAYRDVELTVVDIQTPEYEPVRTASRHEIVLARVDWRGAVRDLRPDPKYCGFASPFAPLDTSTFTTTLDEALRNFDVKSGKTTTTAPGTQAAVTVRKVEGEGAYIDMSIPRGDRGEKGEPGRDGRDGANGVIAPASGFVTFSVEPNGDLFAETPGDDPATAYELDSEGNFYVTTGGA